MKRRTTILSSLGLLACTVSLTGCYERVVRAEGMGASRYDVYEPTEKSGIDKAIDDLFGTGDDKKSPID